MLPSFNLNSSSAYISHSSDRTLLHSCPAVPECIVTWLHVAASRRGVQLSCRRCWLSVMSAASGCTLTCHSTVGSLCFSRPVFFFPSIFLNPQIRLRAHQGFYEQWRGLIASVRATVLLIHSCQESRCLEVFFEARCSALSWPLESSRRGPGPQLFLRPTCCRLSCRRFVKNSIGLQPRSVAQCVTASSETDTTLKFMVTSHCCFELHLNHFFIKYWSWSFPAIITSERKSVKICLRSFGTL